MHYGLGDYLADIAHNAIEAGAGHIEVRLDELGDRVNLVIADNGPGMDEETARRAQDPFYTAAGKHPGRSVGLGLPFVRQFAEACNGAMVLRTAPGEGTTVDVGLERWHVDMPPFGDLATVFQQLMCYGGDFELVVAHNRDSAGYEVRRSELIDAVGELESVGSHTLVHEFFSAQEADL